MLWKWLPRRRRLRQSITPHLFGATMDETCRMATALGIQGLGFASDPADWPLMIDETQELNYRHLATTIADAGFEGFVSHEWTPSVGQDKVAVLRKCLDMFTVVAAHWMPPAPHRPANSPR